MKKISKLSTSIITRRDFIKTSAAGAATVLAGKNVIFAAPAGRKLRIALIGCGGRGNGALANCLDAGKHIENLDLEVVATADWFKNKAEATGKKYNVPASRCFGGAEAYKDLLHTNVDVVLIATSPNFRPVHFEAAIKAGKNVFMEKPVAVDPPGGRRIIAAGELAKSMGLAVVAGTQRRHQASYLRTQYAIERGAIGKIVGGCVWWCGGALWYRTQNPNESDADYMVRNWVSFTEMSGDHIVEQHVHNLDVANWYIGHPPENALGFGGRARRKTGDQFDFFSLDLDYGDGVHIHSMCRQINGTDGGVKEFFRGTQGQSMGGGRLKGRDISTPDFPEHKGPYCQEHVDLLNSILRQEPLNEARNVAESTLTAIMGRISAYTGKMVRWTDITENKKSPWYNLTIKPTAEEFEKGEVEAPLDDIAAVPGRDK
ncbi:MAG: twin-arginine translocation signal domain-containing protein [Planctomycetes bacterium]|nr:twin-arginine translocation signal domain-containing protein [Planctomycetota bacterium]